MHNELETSEIPFCNFTTITGGNRFKISHYFDNILSGLLTSLFTVLLPPRWLLQYAVLVGHTGDMTDIPKVLEKNGCLVFWDMLQENLLLHVYMIIPRFSLQVVLSSSIHTLKPYRERRCISL